MKTMNVSLYELYAKKKITYTDAYARSSNIQEFEEMVRQGGLRAESTGKSFAEQIER
jgi:Tfp pilus assembly ATPase PilU